MYVYMYVCMCTFSALSSPADVILSRGCLRRYGTLYAGELGGVRKGRGALPILSAALETPWRTRLRLLAQAPSRLDL